MTRNNTARDTCSAIARVLTTRIPLACSGSLCVRALHLLARAFPVSTCLCVYFVLHLVNTLNYSESPNPIDSCSSSEYSGDCFIQRGWLVTYEGLNCPLSVLEVDIRVMCSLFF